MSNAVLFNSPSLDRKFNENIMTLDNTWIICSRCNSLKSNNTLECLIKYCRDVTRIAENSN